MDRFHYFTTSVQNLTAEETRAMLDEGREPGLVVLDVRQPHEYASGRIPGATLLPLPELPERFIELDARAPTIVYCAAGVRSRSAAQFLQGRGFQRVWNMTGGMHAWDGRAAYGTPDTGLHLLPENISLERALLVAYGMEIGLAAYYERAQGHAQRDGVRALFRELAHLEDDHAQSVANAYRQVSAEPLSQSELDARVSREHLEGGMTIDEYLNAFEVDLDREEDVLSLAMQIEIQAHDLYLRAAARSTDPATAHALRQAAEEEKAHLQRLGELFHG